MKTFTYEKAFKALLLDIKETLESIQNDGLNKEQTEEQLDDIVENAEDTLTRIEEQQND